MAGVLEKSLAKKRRAENVFLTCWLIVLSLVNQSLLYSPAIHAKNTEDPIPFLATVLVKKFKLRFAVVPGKTQRFPFPLSQVFSHISTFQTMVPLLPGRYHSPEALWMWDGFFGAWKEWNHEPIQALVTFVSFRFSEVFKLSSCFRTMACFSLVNTWTVSPEICKVGHGQTTLT